MPIVDGKKVRARFTSLKLDEISSVDNPAQPLALGSVIKRMEPLEQAIDNICKYIGVDDGAHSFKEVLRDNKFSEQIWPFTDALSQSIRSIVGDKALSGAEREQKIKASVDEFLASVAEIAPTVSKSLEGLLLEEEGNMSKTVEQLEKDLAAAEAKLAKMTDDMKGHDQKMTDMEEELDKTKKALAAATDEVIKVEGLEVRKSEVGEAQFRLTKSLVEKDERREREVKAQKRFPNLVGSVAAKAALLKACEDISDEQTRKAAEQILDSAEKMTSATFERIGKFDPNAEPTRKAAEATFMKRVDEVAERDKISKTAAMQKARREFPQEFAEYQRVAN